MQNTSMFRKLISDTYDKGKVRPFRKGNEFMFDNVCIFFDVKILHANIYLHSYIIDDFALIYDHNTNTITSLKGEFPRYKTKCKSAFVLQVCV